MTPQFKWLMYSIILTILLNVALDVFAEEQITCERIVENVQVNYQKQIDELLTQIVTRCDTAHGEILEFEVEGKTVNIMCWKVQLL